MKIIGGKKSIKKFCCANALCFSVPIDSNTATCFTITKCIQILKKTNFKPFFYHQYPWLSNSIYWHSTSSQTVKGEGFLFNLHDFFRPLGGPERLALSHGSFIEHDQCDVYCTV